MEELPSPVLTEQNLKVLVKEEFPTESEKNLKNELKSIEEKAELNSIEDSSNIASQIIEQASNILNNYKVDVFVDAPGSNVRRSIRKSKRSAKKHLEIYECIECDEKFNRLGSLKTHAKIHNGNPEDYKCTICDVIFDSSKKLVQHNSQNHLSTYCCPICTKSFTNKASIKIHFKQHVHSEKLFPCSECDSTFAQSGHLSIHKRTHTGEKPYTCDICRMTFKQISHLKTHVRIHTKDRPYQCSQCPSSFTQNSSLKRHNRTHTGEKPFQCSCCPMSFVVKSNMLRHLNTHTGAKPYKCDLCPSSFAQAIDLKRHKISHSGIKPFKCDMCDAAFSRNNNLTWHKATHSATKSGFTCTVCSASFLSASDLKAHMRCHAPPKPYVCDSCPNSFRLMESLERHKKIHTGERPLRPNKLNKTSSVISAMKIKPYLCSICESSFCEKRNLKRHLRATHRVELSNTNMIINERLLLESQKNDSHMKMKNESLPVTKADVLGENDGVTNAVVPILSENEVTQQPLLMPQQQILNIQTVGEAAVSLPQMIFSGQGDTNARLARPAGNCQNHSMHILTFLEGNCNQWQSWCFCESPNFPIIDAASHQVLTTQNIGDAFAQILVPPNIQQPILDSTSQIVPLMTALNPSIPEVTADMNPQIIVCNNSLDTTTSSLLSTGGIGSLTLGNQLHLLSTGSVIKAD